MNQIDPKALFRLSVLGPMVSRERLARGELQPLIRELAQREYAIPGTQRRHLGEKTIEAWYYAWRREGIAGLAPKARLDRGQSRISAPIQEAVLAAKRDNPRRSVRQIVRLLEAAGTVARASLSRSAVHRLLQQSGLSRLAGSGHLPEEKRSFTAEFAGSVWYGDVMHGPRVSVKGTLRKTYLVSLIDDASRLVAHSAFCLGETALDVEGVLKQALLRRGVPIKLVVDNGAAYRAHTLQGICARLGIHLIFCRPYAPEGKGKLERWHRTLRDPFLSELDQRHIADMDDLNARLWAWIEQIYHRTAHAGLGGLTPLARYQRDLPRIRSLGAKAAGLDALFHHRIHRLVRKDGTVSYLGERFEVPYELSGKTVRLVVDPHTERVVGVEDEAGHSRGLATALDAIANIRRVRRKPEPAAAPGERSVLLPGCLEYHLALWGGEAAAIVQPLNPLLGDEKLASLMRTAGAKVLIAYGSDRESEIWAKAMRVRDLVPTLTHVLRVAPHDELTGAVGVLSDGILDFNAARALEPDDHLVSQRNIAPTNIAAYFHTGGTTGAPKLARHSHGAQVFTAWASVKLQGVRASDVTINGFPLFHVAGVLPTSLTALSAGLETVIPTPSLLRNREVLANYWRLVEKYRVTTLSAVPTILAALANVPLAGADISSLRYCRTGAALLPPELATRFERLFGLHVHESLGMTEMAGISTITPPGVHGPAGCVGFALPYARLRIVELDATGGATERDLPAGETGMVLFKSPNLFSGFLDPEDNVNAFTADDWLITGDLGWLDGKGRLNLTGRSKDLIIRSGHNIDPKAIEDAIGAHPAVQMCAAVGAPDAYAGELPVVFVTLVPGASVSEAELLAFAAQRVDEAPARPKTATIIDTMPVTNVGKIYKPELRLLAAQAVVKGLVAQACHEVGVAQTRRPPVMVTQPHDISVVLERDRLGAQADALFEHLRLCLARLPIKTEIRGPEGRPVRYPTVRKTPMKNSFVHRTGARP